MKNRFGFIAALFVVGFLSSSLSFADQPHNVILFIPDGLRGGIVDASTAPTLTRLREEGVSFVNSHSLFPTFTTANASAFATGHYFGDTGDFSNSIYTGFKVQAAGDSVTPFLEIDSVLTEVTEHFHGNYLNEDSIIFAARAQNMSTAMIGKLGPVGIFDLRALKGDSSLIVDDSTGREGGISIPSEWLEAFKAAKIKPEAPGRGDNGNAGTNSVPGTLIPNLAQQQYFLEVALKVALPKFKAANRPFVLVYWSRDPDGSQHNHGDSLGAITPGINGPTSLSAIRTMDSALASLQQGLKSLGLAETTNILIASDHGFSTISKASQTSAAAKQSYGDVTPNELPPGFLVMDIADALAASGESVSLFDPDAKYATVDWKRGQHPSRGNGVIGADANAPSVVVASNGGSNLVYIPSAVADADGKRLLSKIVQALVNQDYVSGLFVDTDRFGEQAGALSINTIGLKGATGIPTPAVVVNFASFSSGCKKPLNCGVEIADTRNQTGQGMHGSFSRADTFNFMAALGPDFRKGFVSKVPASNADVGMTIAHLLQLKIPAKGSLVGRVLQESLVDRTLSDGARANARRSMKPKLPKVKRTVIRSAPAANGQRTILMQQSVGDTVYFDAAGFPGRTLGLTAK